jgi:hypothetical protein
MRPFDKKKMTVVFNPIPDEFEKQIKKLLEMLGHPEALVSDESTFLDFLDHFTYPTLDSAQTKLTKLLRDNHVEIYIDVRSTLRSACQQIYLSDKDWPSRKVH